MFITVICILLIQYLYLYISVYIYVLCNILHTVLNSIMFMTVKCSSKFSMLYQTIKSEHSTRYSFYCSDIMIIQNTIPSQGIHSHTPSNFHLLCSFMLKLCLTHTQFNQTLYKYYYVCLGISGFQDIPGYVYKFQIFPFLHKPVSTSTSTVILFLIYEQIVRILYSQN